MPAKLKIRPLLPALLACSCLTAVAFGRAPSPLIIPVWAGDPPGSEGKPREEKTRIAPAGDHVVSSVHHPSLAVYLPTPDQATGAAVVICPGGGHRELWMDHEGYNLAPWLADRGIAAVILKYRLAREEGATYSIEGHSLADAQRALRLVRSRAAEWRLDPARIGIMGFSAGGEVAALASRKFVDASARASDPVERVGSKPAFQALIYPGNAKSIVPDKDSPPAFLLCGFDDRPDISEGLANVYLAFKRAGVQTELHIYSGAGHGFGFRPGNKSPAGAWVTRFVEWMNQSGFLRPAS